MSQRLEYSASEIGNPRQTLPESLGVGVLLKASSVPPLQRCPLHLQPWNPNSPSLSAIGLPMDEATSGGMPVEQRTEGGITPPPPDLVSYGVPDIEAIAHTSANWAQSASSNRCPPVYNSGSQQGPEPHAGGPGDGWVTHATRLAANTKWQEDRHILLRQATMNGHHAAQAPG